jgi:hypothetical protein
VMAGLEPAITNPHQFANDAIPVSNHPMEKPRHDRAGNALSTSTVTALGINRPRSQHSAGVDSAFMKTA